jgi:hypothetical protein
MPQKTLGWNPLNWFISPAANKISRKKTLALETLESREVPAVIVVTNLLDSTNPTNPLAGSFREAVERLATSGDEIRFADSLFPEGEGPKTLTLNGAVGALQIEQNNITIVGPGRYTTGSNEYKLIVQSDRGFSTVSTAQILNGGSGFQVGDYLDQGSTEFTGGARFQVQAVGGSGNITQVAVVNPGANSTFTGTLSSAGTGASFLTAIGNSKGSGAIFSNPSKGLASNIIVSQLINSTPQDLRISGIHFGDAKSTTIIQNLGNMTVTDCLFDSTAGTFIATAGGAGKLTINNSAFDGASTQVSFGSGATLTVNNSTFTGASAMGSGRAISAATSGLTINSSAFHDGENGVWVQGGSTTVNNTYFTNIENGALTVRSSNTKVTNSYFADNYRTDGIQIDPTSYGTPIGQNGPNANKGGAAIFAWDGSSLDVSKSLFLRNAVGDPTVTKSGINNLNSGGGAIFNYGGTLNIDQSGFTENSVAITHFPLIEAYDNTTNFADNPELMPSPANTGGGAVYSGGPTNITNSYFNKNLVTSQVEFFAYTKIPDTPPPPATLPQYAGGGAMFLTSNNGQTANVTLSNLTITENSVEQVTPTANPFVGALVVAVTAADFDNDGADDLAIGSNLDQLNIQIRTGSGFGTFSTTPDFILSGNGQMTDLTAGDFNGDGFADLASASNTTTGNLTVFLNKGLTGGIWLGFDAPVSYSFGTKSQSVVAADLNNDKRADLVLGNNSTTGNIQVALADSSGVFTSTAYTIGSNTADVAVGDLTGDGRPDIAAALATTNNNVRLLINESASPGTFSVGAVSTAGGDPAANPPVAAKPLTAIGIGRLDNGALSDIVVTNAEATDNVFTSLNFDGKTLLPWTKATAGDSARSLVVADFNRDGNDDVAIAQNKDTDNVQVGLSNTTGVLTFNTYTAGTKAYAIAPVKFQTASSTVNLVVGDYNLSNNLQIGRNNGNGGFNFSSSGNVGTTSRGQGLQGGALIIASGVDPAIPNTVQQRAFNGTTNAQLVNVTITNNKLINPYSVGISNSINAIYQNARFGLSPTNSTDTGGLFTNLSDSSSTKLLNTIITRNIGINYTAGGPNGSYTGKGVVGYTDTSRRYNQANNFTSSGYNLYNPTYTQGFPSNGRAVGDLTASDTAPIFDVYGLQNNLGPQIGLLTAQPTDILPDQGQGNVLTIALDRLSPARDAGDSSVYNSGVPIQLNTDARGVKRLINLAVDMGAFEVQFATQTTIVNPALTPAAPPTYPNPYLKATYGVPLTITAKAQWNDNKVPNTAISGTISLVNADDQSIVYATGIVVPLSATDFKLGGLAQLVVNTNDLNVLPTGKNNYIALYSGDTNYAISQTNTFTIDVSPANTTTTLDLGQPDVQSPNKDVVFTGTVNYAPSTQVPAGDIQLERQPATGGAWTQFATGPVDSNGAFSITGQFPTLGDYNVRALFVTADSSKFNNSTSNSVLEQIGYIPTVDLNPFSNPVERGVPVNFTAVVTYLIADGVPTGTVTFQTSDGSLNIATVNPPTPSPAGILTYSVTVDPSMLPLGDNSIVAIYNRNGGSYVSQTSKDQTLTLVGRATTTTLTASPVSGVYGSPVQFTATVTPNGPPPYAGGSVEFYSAGTLVQSIPLAWDSSGNPLPVTYTSYGLEAGSLSVVAVYTGDLTNYQGSTSNEVVIDVSEAATQLTLNPSASRVEVGTPVTLTATLTNSAEDPAVQPSGVIDFYRDGLKIGTAALKGTTATFVVTPDQVGTFNYEAKYAGNNNYGSSAGTTTVAAFQQVQENFYLVAPQSGPFVQMFNRITNEQMTVFQPFGPNYTGGFTVTKGDVNNDGIADLLYSPRIGGQIQVFDGSNFNPLGAIYPFGAGFPMSLSIAVGDINGDGFGDIISAPSGIGMPPHVVATSGRDLNTTLFSQYAYAPTFLGGVSVAAGEVNGDGAMDIITAPLVGAPPHIVSFDGKTGAVLQSYYAYSPLYKGGTSITASDLNGDGFAEIITGASASAPHVVIVDARTQSVKASFYAYAPTFGGGVRVATVQDLNADGIDDIIVSPGPGAGPNIVRFDGKKALQNQAVVIDSFFAYGSGPSLNYYGGTFVG